MEKYGDKIWEHGSLSVYNMTNGGRWQLYFGDEQIAEKLTIPENPTQDFIKNWVTKKIEERFLSTSKHEEKVVEQLAQIRLTKNMWSLAKKELNKNPCKTRVSK